MQTAVRSTVPSTAVRSVVSASGLRLAHSYVSAFIAPMIVFFAISGSLQIYDLHEAHDAYKPGSLISSLARLHKNQVFAPEPQHGAEPPGGRQAEATSPGDRPKGELAKKRAPQGKRPEREPTLATQILKALFVFEALALVLTTLLGVWIGVTHPKRARTFWIILGAGALLPIALIAVQDFA